MSSIEEELAILLYKAHRDRTGGKGTWGKLEHFDRVTWREIAGEVFAHLAVAASQPDFVIPEGYVKVHSYVRRIGDQGRSADFHVPAGGSEGQDRLISVQGKVLAKSDLIKTRPDLGKATVESGLRHGDGHGGEREAGGAGMDPSADRGQDSRTPAIEGDR